MEQEKQDTGCNFQAPAATNHSNRPKTLTGKDLQQDFVNLLNDTTGIIHKVCNLYADDKTSREDLFQEIVLQLWKGYPRFRGEAKFSTWVYRIALNTAISDLRRQNRSITLDYPEFIPKEEAVVSGDPNKEALLEQLYAAIGRLSEVDRALVMLYLDERSYEEMEEILGINQNNLRVKMNRIKEKLRQLTKTEVYGS